MTRTKGVAQSLMIDKDLSKRISEVCLDHNMHPHDFVLGAILTGLLAFESKEARSCAKRKGCSKKQTTRTAREKKVATRKAATKKKVATKKRAVKKAPAKKRAYTRKAR